jgi:endonuclease YncB( thermonuclease family)
MLRTLFLNLWDRPISKLSTFGAVAWMLFSFLFGTPNPADLVDPTRTDGVSPRSLEVGDLFSGKAYVIDGDTLVVDGARVRLFGVDAFEMNQSCRVQGNRDYLCGELAKETLETFIGSDPVLCTVQDIDRYGRAVSICRSSSVDDLGAAMVHAGLALAYRQFSTAYVAIEEGARDARAGAWQGFFMEPWRVRY